VNKIFLTASGTGIGKTFVTRVLIHQLRTCGRAVRALKPIATGFGTDGGEPSDTELLLRSLGLETDAKSIDAISPWRFSEPLSPDMAAAREQTSIEFEQLIAFCEAQGERELTLIEGIGGVMVPLDAEHCVLDWIAALGAPSLLVVGSYLGTLSHTLTAAGMLRAKGIEIAGIVVNESEAQPVPAQETAEVVARFVPTVPIRVLNRLERPEDAPDLLPLLAPYL